ncbi:unnamed protein product [Cuscuta epithymum]|uniref:Oligopeptide transporter n=1 Tax=Cuscuta epithymum TaxID=186058 RepID=A0AAV0E8I5_9ASTE|nr:unnamed protein product [Cuscuta epithymum]
MVLSIERDPEGSRRDDGEDDDDSPVEQVRLTVSTHDDPTLPVWTFRMWTLGILSCAALSFLNTFFGYRTEPLIISMISVQVITLPAGRFMAKVLPERTFRVGSWEFSLNPGPFNMKEHVLISIFANAGSAFGSGTAYAVGIVNIIKAFYMRKISFLAGWILVITTQVLGYGWAGILRKYVIDPGEMWWPQSLVQVSLFRALHEKEENTRSMTKWKFFWLAMLCGAIWYIVPGFLFPTISNISLLCLIYPKSVMAQQIGSGMRGLGIFSFTFDWSVIASYLTSPLVTPFFAIANITVGYVAVIYVIIPIAYWGLNLYSARTYPLFSSHLFNNQGQVYNVSSIVNERFELDKTAYARQGRISLSIFFALSYGLNFASVIATLTHVALFNGRDIYNRFKSSHKGKDDIHTRLMKKYKDIPAWWFYVTLALSLALSLFMCIFMKNEIQLPWWGLLLAVAVACLFTLPISVITATTNQTPGLNVITEYILGLLMPGKPIANVCFKTFGYISMSQAVSFLNDFKLGHYMKIPPRSMFIVQLVGTVVAGTINIAVAWGLLTSIPNICQDNLLPPNSQWTCPNDRVFFDASVIWGLVGPKRIFGSLGRYGALNWGFLLGAMSPLVVWLFQRGFPSKRWISLINLPVLLSATATMPPATSLNFNSWIVVGTIFNFFIFRYRRKWWQRYNYVLSAAMDAGLACMAVALYFGFEVENVSVNWWGSQGEHCDLATCPTARGIQVDGCPIF